MKSFLIIGGGSIGKRHLRNLLSLGQKDISVVEVNPVRAKDIEKEFKMTVFKTLAAALKVRKFDCVFVCSPSVYHLENALLAAKAGCDLFIEKPLSHSMNGIDKLLKIVKQKNLITMVGCNWKFYPSFQKMKELIDKGAIGRVLSARCQFGQYLPDWHPWEDYRKGYSANKKLGGGILLDSHEFDYLTWFMGPVKKLACFAKRISNLEINVEDTADVILEFKSGALGSIHLDYTQRFYERSFEFVGETGSITWNAAHKKVTLKSKVKGIKEFILAASYDFNLMYIEEVKHFLVCLDKSKKTVMPIEQGREVLALIMGAKDSVRKKKIIIL